MTMQFLLLLICGAVGGSLFVVLHIPGGAMLGAVVAGRNHIHTDPAAFSNLRANRHRRGSRQYADSPGADGNTQYGRSDDAFHLYSYCGRICFLMDYLPSDRHGRGQFPARSQPRRTSGRGRAGFGHGKSGSGSHGFSDGAFVCGRSSCPSVQLAAAPLPEMNRGTGGTRTEPAQGGIAHRRSIRPSCAIYSLFRRENMLYSGEVCSMPVRVTNGSLCGRALPLNRSRSS